jgi:hypothetical protein
MFDPPLETWYAWLGLGLVSLAVAGTGLSLPTAAPPAPAPVADTIDSVAASSNAAVATVSVQATEVRLRPRRVSLRSDGGTAHARLAFGPVVPVDDGSLRRVLSGTPPDRVFRSPVAFAQRLAAAQSRRHDWRSAPAALTVRRVTWGDVDATLVG